MSDNDDQHHDAHFLEVRRKLANKVRTLRKKKGMGQDEFAFTAGIHRTHIGSIENAKTDLRLSTMLKLAETLDITLEELFS